LCLTKDKRHILTGSWSFAVLLLFDLQKMMNSSFCCQHAVEQIGFIGSEFLYWTWCLPFP